MAASKYCKDPNYAKGAKGKAKLRKKEIMGELAKWRKQNWVCGSEQMERSKAHVEPQKIKNPDRCLPMAKKPRVSVSLKERLQLARKKLEEQRENNL